MAIGCPPNMDLAATRLHADPAERSVKIVATMGPPWESEEMLLKMISAGVDIVRLNCSHRFEGAFEAVYPRIHAAAKAAGRKVEVLGDLQGPKFRTTDCTSLVMINPGDIVTFALASDDSDITRITELGARITMKPTVEQQALIAGLTVGMEILIEDGRRRVKVLERASEIEVKVEVIVGGRVMARQGVNVPALQINCPALTGKDLTDARFLLGLDPPIDYIAMSFVQKAEDIQELIDLMDSMNVPPAKRPKICPKIEKPQALSNLDAIICKSQALMVARGDLGVEIGLPRVPLAQKVMVHMAKAKGLFPVIVATQMMESMIQCPIPQRSEISDIANAVYDGADAVMLSSEASMGAWPVETVTSMASAALHAQKMKSYVTPPLNSSIDMTTVLAPFPPADARRTLILATLGPASKSQEIILKLVAAGVDIFRLNCTYRQPGVFEGWLNHIQTVSQSAGRQIEVMANLQGPKFSITSVFWTGVQLEEGLPVTLALAASDADVCRPGGTGVRITMAPTVHQTALLAALEPEMLVYIEEGKRRLKVTKRISKSEVLTKVVVGGKLSPCTNVEAPGVTIDCPALTDKDLEDAEFLLGLSPPIDYIAVPFVQKGADLQPLIDLMDRLSIPPEKRPKICPRIERSQALLNLDDILLKSEGVIVARGELGFELGLEGVPFAQKLMMHRAKMKGSFPVMVSTQLMESMIKNATPTRAEVSDVMNAVFDGADVIMLSGETAKGSYPIESVAAMAACVLAADAQKHLVTPAFGLLPECRHCTVRLPMTCVAPVYPEASLSCQGRVVVMMGPPASGKGSQCKRLSKEFGIVHLSVGDIIRDEIKRGTDLGAQVNVYMSRGDMVSDALTMSIVRERLAKEDVARCGCFLDGFPRTAMQAQALAESVKVDLFILFTVPDDVVVTRALGRLNDPITGEIYHVQSAPPTPDIVSRLVRRNNDDCEEVVRTRLKFYHSSISEILPHFGDRVQVIDGTQSLDDVTFGVRSILLRHFGTQS